MLMPLAPLLRQLRAGLSAFQTMFADDPALLALQVCRRLPLPVANALSPLTRVLPSGQTIAAMLQRDLQRAAQTAQPSPRNGFEAAVWALAGMCPPRKYGRAYARFLQRIGKIPEAIDAAPPALQSRLVANAAIQTDGFALPTADLPARTYQVPQGRHRALHILTNSLPFTQSGYSLRTHQVLLAQTQAGISVRALTRLGYPLIIGKVATSDRQQIDGVDYARMLPASWPRLWPARLARSAKEAAIAANSFAPNVLHTTTDFKNALVTAALAKRFDLPWVYEMRGELESTWLSKLPEEYRASGETSWYYRHLARKETLMAAMADAVVVLSAVHKQRLCARGVDAHKIFVVPNLPLSPPAQCTRLQARAQLGIPADRKLFGSISSIVAYEGLETAIYALAQLCQRGEDVHLALVGSGESVPALKALAAKCQVAHRVSFVGRVSPERARLWYKALDCFVIPRRDEPVTRTVTPIKGMEAVAAGTPLICANLPALAEITPPSPSGTLVEAANVSAWADAVAKVLNHPVPVAAPPLRTWADNAQIYDQIYKKVRGI